MSIGVLVRTGCHEIQLPGNVQKGSIIQKEFPFVLIISQERACCCPKGQENNGNQYLDRVIGF